MTITNPEYFSEIIGLLRSKGVSLNHFTLRASKDTLLKRLRSRGDSKTSWAAEQIDRCISSFESDIFQQYIDTDNMSIEDVVERIALESNISLMPDKRNKFHKKFSRTVIKLKHTRLFSRWI